MANIHYLTEEGLKTLQTRLNLLKTEKRGEVANKLAAAREYGDLSENAEYDSAKEEQASIESEIFEIEQTLKNAKIINDKDIDTSRVSVGCSVKVLNEKSKTEHEYRIVGSTESDPRKNLISNQSPIGLALLGAKTGEVISFNAPAGVMSFKILKISR